MEQILIWRIARLVEVIFYARYQDYGTDIYLCMNNVGKDCLHSDQRNKRSFLGNESPF